MSFDPGLDSIEEVKAIVRNIQLVQSVDAVEELSHSTHVHALQLRIFALPQGESKRLQLRHEAAERSEKILGTSTPQI